jgi:3-deoxy-D-manno-octulosonic-acid transferase
MIVGPHTENFAEAAGLLREARGMVEIRQAVELTEAVAGLLRNPHAARKMGLEARQTIVARRGATERIVIEIMKRID